MTGSTVEVVSGPAHPGGILALALLPALLAACSTAERRDETARPNVVIIMTDDQGYGDLSCHGNPWLETPHLDRLHAESVRLTNFHVSPLCSPTRAALLTGRHSRHVGVRDTNNCKNLLARGVPTLAGVLGASGYRTGIFGKWHLGEHYPHRPQDRGFQESVVHGNGAITTNGDIWGNDYYDDAYWHNGRRQKYEGYCTDVWFRLAMDFMKASEQPFFCYIPTNAPHGPFIVPARYTKPYLGNEDIPNANFFGMISNIDENVGRLLQFLDGSGLAENTIVIFLTDNGSAGGCRFENDVLTAGYNAGMRGRKASSYEGGHRVPFFIRWPAGGLTGGRDVDRLTAHIDVLPTLLDFCGAQPPAAMKLDGSSLRPLLEGNHAGWPDRTLVESHRGTVMTERWRFIHGRELYDVRADPAQEDDIAARHPEVVTALREVLEENRRLDDQREQGVVIGSDHQNPVALTAEQWQAPRRIWLRHRVLEGEAMNGPVLLEVQQPGTFEFSLRRWPEEVNRTMRASVPDGRALEIVSARLKVGSFDETRPVDASTIAATFQIPLEAGETTLETWLTTAAGESSGAYFIYVRRL